MNVSIAVFISDQLESVDNSMWRKSNFYCDSSMSQNINKDLWTDSNTITNGCCFYCEQFYKTNKINLNTVSTFIKDKNEMISSLLLSEHKWTWQLARENDTAQRVDHATVNSRAVLLLHSEEKCLIIVDCVLSLFVTVAKSFCCVYAKGAPPFVQNASLRVNGKWNETHFLLAFWNYIFLELP